MYIACRNGRVGNTQKALMLSELSLSCRTFCWSGYFRGIYARVCACVYSIYRANRETDTILKLPFLESGLTFLIRLPRSRMLCTDCLAVAVQKLTVLSIVSRSPEWDFLFIIKSFETNNVQYHKSMSSTAVSMLWDVCLVEPKCIITLPLDLWGRSELFRQVWNVCKDDTCAEKCLSGSEKPVHPMGSVRLSC